MLQAAASNPGLRAVVSEGAGVRVWSARTSSADRAAGWRSRSRDSVDGGRGAERTESAPSLTDLFPRISPRPLFLISAGHGGGGEELNADYYRAALHRRSSGRSTGARHVGGLKRVHSEYDGASRASSSVRCRRRAGRPSRERAARSTTGGANPAGSRPSASAAGRTLDAEVDSRASAARIGSSYEERSMRPRIGAAAEGNPPQRAARSGGALARARGGGAGRVHGDAVRPRWN